MRIDRIRFQNFRCFEDREFELANRFNLVIGDNGTGKTSVLNGLSMAIHSVFVGAPHFGGALSKNHDVVRTLTFWNNGKPNVEDQFPVNLECTGELDQKEVEWTWTLPKRSRSSWQVTGFVSAIFSEMQKRVGANSSVMLPVLGYYGTGRVWTQVKPRSKIETLSPGSRFLGYQDCLDPASDERRLLKWFKTRELVALQKKKKLDDLEAVRQAIRACVSDASEVYWDMETDQLAIRFDKPDKPVTWFKNLSDGYRNMLAMVADIAQRCVTLNPQLGKDAIRNTPGIVLIDEIDLHLHPKWQQRVVEDLLRAFPLVQFVATTHSPFIIQSLVPKKGIKLINLDDPKANDFANKSVEDISEDVQGVEMPQRSKRYQDMMKAAEEYYRALQHGANGSANHVQELKDRLDELTARFSDDPAYHALLKVEREAKLAKGS